MINTKSGVIRRAGWAPQVGELLAPVIEKWNVGYGMRICLGDVYRKTLVELYDGPCNRRTIEQYDTRKVALYEDPAHTFSLPATERCRSLTSWA
jgi:hypothetical protein